jgi:polysaccharide export outer membrane protein
MSQAQDTVTAAPAYRIAALDVVDITVQDHADLSRTLSVLPDGTISFPYVGELQVSGLTIPQLTEKITAALRKQIAGPIVIASMRTIHEAPLPTVSILGTVKSPGKRTLKEGWHVLDLLIDAGGLTVDRPELFSASLIRSGSIVVPIDLARVLAVVDQNANATLMPNDVVLVRELELSNTQAQVFGEVLKPGSYPVDREGSVVTLIGAAGGVTLRAALSKATITHAGKTTEVDLRSVITEGKPPPGIKIAPGDSVFIPTNKQFYSLFGAVGRPGMQEYPDGGTVSVLTAISLAGGQVQGANLTSVSIIHPMKDGKSSIVKINVDKMMKQGDLTHDMKLHPGDIVYVPSRRRTGLGLADVITYLPMLGMLAGGL